MEAVPSGGAAVVYEARVVVVSSAAEVVIAEVLRVAVTVSTTRWTVLVMVQVVTRLLSEAAAGYASWAEASAKRAAAVRVEKRMVLDLAARLIDSGWNVG